MSLGADVNAQVSASHLQMGYYQASLVLSARAFAAGRTSKLSRKHLEFLMVPGALQWPNCPPSGSGPAESRPGVTPIEVWG